MIVKLKYNGLAINYDNYSQKYNKTLSSLNSQCFDSKFNIHYYYIDFISEI